MDTNKNSNLDSANEEEKVGMLENPVYEITKIISKWREEQE